MSIHDPGAGKPSNNLYGNDGSAHATSELAKQQEAKQQEIEKKADGDRKLLEKVGYKPDAIITLPSGEVVPDKGRVEEDSMLAAMRKGALTKRPPL